MIDSAFYMEQQNMISKNLKEYQKAKEQCLHKSRQRKELTQTKELIKWLKKDQRIQAYDKTLFQAIIKKIIVNPNELVFQLKKWIKTDRKKEKSMSRKATVYGYQFAEGIFTTDEEQSRMVQEILKVYKVAFRYPD